MEREKIDFLIAIALAVTGIVILVYQIGFQTFWTHETREFENLKLNATIYKAIIYKKDDIYIAELFDGKKLEERNASLLINNIIEFIKQGRIKIKDSIYEIRDTIRIKDQVELEGSEKTVFDVSGIGRKRVIILGNNTSLTKIKFSGSIDPPPKAVTQSVFVSGDNVLIEDIEIDTMGYGIDIVSKNVRIKKAVIKNIMDEKGWAAAIHATLGAKNVSISDFYIDTCDRGVEIEDGAEDIIVYNGYIKNVKMNPKTKQTPFSLDVHTHGEYSVKNVTFRNITMENCTMAMDSTISVGGNYLLLQNITFESIKIINSSEWFTRIEGSKIKVIDVHGLSSLARIYGEDMVFQNVTFYEPSKPFKVNNIVGQKILFENCAFINEDKSPKECGIKIDDLNSIVTFLNTTFQSSYVPYSKGAVCVLNTTKVLMRNVKIINDDFYITVSSEKVEIW